MIALQLRADLGVVWFQAQAARPRVVSRQAPMSPAFGRLFA
jgi:hypothetical protein